MMDGYEYVKEHGIELKNDYTHKYAKRKMSCKHKSSRIAFKNTSGSEEDEVSNERLKELVAIQPIAVAMYSSSMLQHYKQGVMTEKYLACSSTKHEVNHAVVIVGYGKVKEDDKIYGKGKTCEEYWMVRNSWGYKWGENGFFRLCMDEYGAKHQKQGICQVNYYTQRPLYDANALPEEAEAAVVLE